eukprot:PhM_4_TR6544/c0_g1_i1/m.48338
MTCFPYFVRGVSINASRGVVTSTGLLLSRWSPLHPRPTSPSILAHMQQEHDMRTLIQNWVARVENNTSGGTTDDESSSRLTLQDFDLAWIEAAVELRDAESVGRMVRWVRETAEEALQDDADDSAFGTGLRPYHFHTLLRVFVYSSDFTSAVQLLTTMEGRGLQDASTYAWVLWATWRSAGVQETRAKMMLHVCQLSIKHNALLQDDLEIVSAARASSQQEEQQTQSSLHSPLLSMLLHCTAHSASMTVADFSIESSFLIALTMRACDVPLRTADYLNLFSHLLHGVARFPRLRRLVLASSDRATYSLSNVIERAAAVMLNSGNTRLQSTIHNIDTLLHSVLLPYARACGVDVKKALTPQQTGRMFRARVVSLEGFIREVLIDVVEQWKARPDLVDAAVIFDFLVTHGSVHRRHVLAVYSMGLLVQHAQPSVSEDQLVPTWTTVAQLSDIIATFPRATVDTLQARYLFLHDRTCVHVPEQTEKYLLTQMIAFARTPQEMLDLLSSRIMVKGSQVAFSITREAFRCALDACAAWAPRNPKLSRQALQERYRWWLFNDCRDIGLVIYGAVPDINAKIRTLYRRNGTPEPLRSELTMETEFKAFAAAIGKDAPGGRGINRTYKRKTKSYLRLPFFYVPKHLTDVARYNPYPHAVLPSAAVDVSSSASENEDPFPVLWENIQRVANAAAGRVNDSLSSKATSSTSNTMQWFIHDRETALRIVRCFIHRLDWASAVQIMTSSVNAVGFSTRADRELQKIFMEIGDPSGAVSFKLAARVLDGDVAPTRVRHHSNPLVHTPTAGQRAQALKDQENAVGDEALY